MPRNLYVSVQQPLLDRGALEEPTRAFMARIPARVLERRRQRAADGCIKQFIANQSFDPAFVGSLRAPIKPSAPVNKRFKPRKLPSLKQKVQRIPLHLPETMYERSGLYPAEELARSRHEQKHQALVAANRRRVLHRLRHQEPDLLPPQEPITRPSLMVPDRVHEMSVLHSKHMLVPHRPSGARPTLLQHRTYQGKPRLGNDTASEDVPGTKTLSTAAVCGSDKKHTTRLVGADAAFTPIVQTDILKTSGGCQPGMPDAVSDQTELDISSAAGNHADYAISEVHVVDSVDLEFYPLLDTEAPSLLAQAAGKSDAPKTVRDAQRVASFLALHADQLVLRGSAATDIDVKDHRLVGELDAGPAVEHGRREHPDADCATLGAMRAETAEAGKATYCKVQIVADALSQHAAAVDLQAEKATHNSQPESPTSVHHETGASASEDGIHGSALFPETVIEAEDDSEAQIEEAILAEEVDWPSSPGSVAGELLAEDMASQLVQRVFASVDEFDSSCKVETITA